MRQSAGDVTYTPAGEWHGFANDTDEPCVVLALFGGVGTYADVATRSTPTTPTTQ